MSWLNQLAPAAAAPHLSTELCKTSARILWKLRALSWRKSSLLNVSNKLLYTQPTSPPPLKNAWPLDLQRGQLEWDWNHLSMHSTWNTWWQFGRCLSHSPSSNSPKQTPHSLLASSCDSFLNWEIGRERTMVGSSPRLGNSRDRLCSRLLAGCRWASSSRLGWSRFWDKVKELIAQQVRLNIFW